MNWIIFERAMFCVEDDRGGPVAAVDHVLERDGRRAPGPRALIQLDASRRCVCRRVPLPKTRELGNLGPKFHWMGAPPWQASVAACLGSPWDPRGLVSGLLGLVSSRASRRPSRNAHTLDSPAPLPSPAPFPILGTLHPYPRRVNPGKRVPPSPLCCPAGVGRAHGSARRRELRDHSAGRGYIVRRRDRRRRGDASGYRGRCSRGHSHDAKPLCVADAAADRRSDRGSNRGSNRGSDISADRDPRQRHRRRRHPPLRRQRRAPRARARRVIRVLCTKTP